MITKSHLHIIIPHLSTFWSGVLGSTAVFSQKEAGGGGEAKNSAHFESCLKFAARVQIAVKHVHDIEWLICIKKKKGGGMKGWKEVREGRLRELLGARKAKSLWILCHYTCRREGGFIFNLWTWCPLNLLTFCNVTTTDFYCLFWVFEPQINTKWTEIVQSLWKNGIRRSFVERKSLEDRFADCHRI